MKIDIIMPSLNEEKGLGKLAKEIPFNEFEKRGIKCNVMIVDGGSTDKSIEVAKKNSMAVIESQKGYGIQYRNAFRKTKGDYIATMDSDASYDPQDIAMLYDYLIEKNIDFVTGDRLTNIKEGVMQKHYYVANKFLNFWVRLIYGVKVKDSQSGMWVFKRSILSKIKLRSKGMPLSEEIKIESFKKLRAGEMPISYRPRIGREKIRPIIDGSMDFFYLFWKRFRDFF